MQPWLNNNLGKSTLNPDPPHGINGQCVNAASSWSMAQGGPELMGPTAYSIFQNFRDPFYSVINGSGGLLSGDIVFYAPNNSSVGTGPAGHVDIYVKPISNGFQGADTDWNSNPNLQLINHSFNGVVGCFRKITQQGGDMTDVDTLRRIGFFVYGLDGQNGKPNALNGDADAQFAPLLGKPTNDVLATLVDDQYGQAWKNQIIAFENGTPPNAKVLSSGIYQVK